MTLDELETDRLDREPREIAPLREGGLQPHHNSDAVRLHYELRGQGPNLTIVNNFFIIRTAWSIIRQLVRHHRVLTYDLRNQGAAAPAVAEADLAGHVRDLKGLLDRLGVERTYLLGTSTSTLICRDFAIAYPERVLGMILVGPAFCPFGSKRWKYLTKSWLNSLETGGPRALFDHLYPLIYNGRSIGNGGTVAYLALRECFLAVNRHEQLRANLSALLASDDDPVRLRQVQCLTLLLAGDGDFLSSPTSLEATARIMPQARVEVIPFAGHVPCFEATTAFENSVQNFIAESERSHEQRLQHSSSVRRPA